MFNNKKIKELEERLDNQNEINRSLSVRIDKLKDLFLGLNTSTFKAGDTVKHKITGEIDTVVSVPGMPEYDKCYFTSPKDGLWLEKGFWCYKKYWEVVKSTPEKKNITKSKKK